MKTKEDFVWHRPYSALPKEYRDVVIKAGAPVTGNISAYWVDSCYFVAGSIEEHDAQIHGCRVATENIDFEGRAGFRPCMF